MTSTAIPQELKAEAARTLIERLMEKTALVRLFRFNAAMKHGVPIKDREIEISKPVAEPTVQQVAPVTPATPAPMDIVRRDATERQQVTSTAATSQDPWWKSWVLPASLLGAGTLATIGGYLATQGGADAQRTTTIENVMYESPLQYIEDQGGHLP